jgi:hypothetical protein
MSRADVVLSFSESAENIERLRPVVERGLWDGDDALGSVARLYWAALARAPDAGGLRYWDGAHDAGRSLGDIADCFAGASEFQARYGALSNRAFVEQLYLNTLQRPGDAAGINYWTAVLDSGRHDRGDILLGFSDAVEHMVMRAGQVGDGILLV